MEYWHSPYTRQAQQKQWVAWRVHCTVNARMLALSNSTKPTVKLKLGALSTHHRHHFFFTLSLRVAIYLRCVFFYTSTLSPFVLYSVYLLEWIVKSVLSMHSIAPLSVNRLHTKNKPENIYSRALFESVNILF